MLLRDGARRRRFLRRQDLLDSLPRCALAPDLSSISLPPVSFVTVLTALLGYFEYLAPKWEKQRLAQHRDDAQRDPRLQRPRHTMT